MLIRSVLITAIVLSTEALGQTSGPQPTRTLQPAPVAEVAGKTQTTSAPVPACQVSSSDLKSLEQNADVAKAASKYLAGQIAGQYHDSPNVVPDLGT